MRKIALLFAVVILAGCAGNGDHPDVSADPGPPIAGNYTGDASLVNSYGASQATATIDSGTVNADGTTHIVLSPMGGDAGHVYTIDGQFLQNHMFHGTVTVDSSGTYNFTNGTYQANGGEFKLSVPGFPSSDRRLVVVGHLTLLD